MEEIRQQKYNNFEGPEHIYESKYGNKRIEVSSEFSAVKRYKY